MIFTILWKFSLFSSCFSLISIIFHYFLTVFNTSQYILFFNNLKVFKIIFSKNIIFFFSSRLQVDLRKNQPTRVDSSRLEKNSTDSSRLGKTRVDSPRLRPLEFSNKYVTLVYELRLDTWKWSSLQKLLSLTFCSELRN